MFLSIDEVLDLHAVQLRAFGGMPGVRDEGMLESALAMPEAGFGDSYVHADVFEMAAAYCFHIVMNHPFVDGNERTGLHAAVVFLDMNGLELALGSDAVYDLVIGVCEGTVTKKALAAAFREHAEPLHAG